MKIRYKAVVHHMSITHKTFVSYRLDDFDACCRQMEEAFGADAVFFGRSPGDNKSSHSNGSSEATAAIAMAEIDHDGCLDHSNFPIKFCPFCAAEIKYEKTKEVTLEARERKIEKTMIDYVEVDVPKSDQ